MINIRIWEGSNNIIPLHETKGWNEGYSALLSTYTVNSFAVPEIFIIRGEGLL